ncbi:dicarboxylate/amino acid:cation symporter [Wolbachia endosymbiont of Diaphorina citri]|jgi:Na+/H+-dicarboxylate symporters|uniref:dicarboxylate/amino acid:cation symporter n=1 Tax=Wolbachia endosymbiont of Diaphorina citri TaxID=116598 RepID=UPI0002DE3882|nr:dicarboxylate/amino acid:cation symporter [Wolbachia endosymbiont of Diaphorina citri]QJT94538.1 dicarboxylate/amino acid:cation symporter [Wolbachia endosymbiont of Diaphorina citri]QJT95778.1 dicarboxylate/amino acid:cation symporter [Wolbachia endosymbiont of Diaphorina citri]QJT97140.1 dicarboxylate/amino acid:cation symporter [Wolbachia endosymbiont of Diaphorina citri]QLK11436.1 dicarboxylate/amino acid:cation symporter [Wolbachia endosymbiont of Diaphorina citri]QXY87033.1 dicarboxyl
MRKLAILFSILFAIIAYYLNNEVIFEIAKLFSDIFISLLKLISLPLVFLSIVSTISGLKDSIEIKVLLKKTLFYTLFTTIVAAFVALSFYLFIDPVRKNFISNTIESVSDSNHNYFSYLKSLIPSNFVQVFLENNVIGSILIAFLMGGAIISLSKEKQDILHQIFSALFDTLLKIAQGLLKFIPLAVWSFITCFLYELKGGSEFHSLFWYFACIMSANFVQAFVILPLLMWYKGISPIQTMKGVMPALTLAFFSKSSSATLPTTIDCVQNQLKVPKKLSSFILPICTTINMNACAAFILITVMFVAEMNGHTFSLSEMFIWIFLATGAAIGNAGVPMGCYFMATSYLVSMNVPLYIMGLILPIYTIIDMFETAINVWSDICITQIINKEFQTQE